MTRPWEGAAAPASAADFLRAAEAIGCDLAALRALWQVEAAGRPWRADGSLTRRFEPHKTSPPLMGYRAGLALGPAARDRLFARHYAAHPADALAASSWGGPQIMGLHHAALGYGSAAEMVADFAASEGAQLAAFARFVVVQGLAPALRGHDWRSFARGYNGAANIAAYAARLEEAYRRIAGQASPQVLRAGDRGAAVRRLQAALGITVDGAFGPETLAALREAQARAGLPVDGVAGARSWDALAKASLGDGDASDRGALTPPVQPTASDLAARVTAQAGAGAAVLGTVSAGLRELPEAATLIVVGAACLAGIMALVAWLYARARA